MKSRELLASFMQYCLAHPEERFWQALRNWSGYTFIYASNEVMSDDALDDTFYWENKSNN